MQWDSISKGAAMTTMASLRSELAHRSTDGIDVSLFWSRRSDRVTIEVVDTRINQRIEFEVPPEKALDAFHHPYPYAPVGACDAIATKAVAQR